MSFQMRPCGAAIIGTIDAASQSAADQAVWCAVSLPERSEKNMRIMRIEGNVNGAAFLVLVEHFFPGLTAVGCAEQAALGVRAIGVAQSRHEHPVRILRVNDNPADETRVFQAYVGPGLPAVHGPVDSVTIRNVATDAGFSGSHINDVRIRGCDGHATD